MPATPPVNFEELVRGATGTTSKDYPYAIKASDLMKDFVFATLIVEEGVYEETTGTGGHRQRRLKIPTPPSSGTHVLGSVGGAIQWQTGGGIVREYFVSINGTLYREGFLCAEKDEDGNTYPVEVT